MESKYFQSGGLCCANLCCILKSLGFERSMVIKMRKKGFDIIAYGFAFIWLIVTIFPLVITFLCSFKNNEGINLSMFALPDIWHWENYAAAVERANILRAVFNSIFLAIMTTLLVEVIGMMAAYVLSRKNFRVLSVISILFLFGVMVPIHCTVIPINNLATALHSKNQYYFLLLVYTAFQLAQSIFLFTGYLQGISRDLDEAAIIDGANDVVLLFKILMPVSKPIMSTVAVLSFVYCYGELMFSMTLLTKVEKFTVSRAMLTFSGEELQLGPIFACIIIAVVPIIIFYLAFHEKVQDGMMQGAIKG